MFECCDELAAVVIDACLRVGEDVQVGLKVFVLLGLQSGRRYAPVVVVDCVSVAEDEL